MARQDLMPPEVQALLREDEPQVEAQITEPPDTVFQLSAGYLDLDGGWHTEFQVRELTGRDEEIIGRVSKIGPMLVEILQRGLVRVGPHDGKDVMDSLLAGDWETVLLAIRVVTFGAEVDYNPLCGSCNTRFDVTVDLTNDVSYQRMHEPEDLHFFVEGRHGTQYRVGMPLGATQRKSMQALDLSLAEQASLILADCVERVDGKPALGKETVLNMPMADRRKILEQITLRRPGPRLQEVTTLCPSCGVENPLPLNIAALFQ